MTRVVPECVNEVVPVTMTRCVPRVVARQVVTQHCVWVPPRSRPRSITHRRPAPQSAPAASSQAAPAAALLRPGEGRPSGLTGVRVDANT